MTAFVAPTPIHPSRAFHLLFSLQGSRRLPAPILRCTSNGKSLCPSLTAATQPTPRTINLMATATPERRHHALSRTLGVQRRNGVADQTAYCFHLLRHEPILLRKRLEQCSLANRYRQPTLIGMAEPSLAGRSATARNRRRHVVPVHPAVGVGEPAVSVPVASRSDALADIQPRLARLGRPKAFLDLGLDVANHMPPVTQRTAGATRVLERHGLPHVFNGVSHRSPGPQLSSRSRRLLVAWRWQRDRKTASGQKHQPLSRLRNPEICHLVDPPAALVAPRLDRSGELPKDVLATIQQSWHVLHQHRPRPKCQDQLGHHEQEPVPRIVAAVLRGQGTESLARGTTGEQRYVLYFGCVDDLTGGQASDVPFQ